jgi:hypothetical protein
MTDYLLILHPAEEKYQNTAAKSTGAFRGTILTNAKKEKKNQGTHDQGHNQRPYLNASP